MYSSQWSSITFDGNTMVASTNNKAKQSGGVIYSTDHSNVTFNQTTMLNFSNNQATYGGVLTSTDHSSILMCGNVTTFFKNTATYGGVILSFTYSNISFDGNTTVIFNGNNAGSIGGAVYLHDFSNISFSGNSNITFNENSASTYGGALLFQTSCTATFEENSTVTFAANTAQMGGAVYCSDYSNLSISSNSTITFMHNTAVHGGAVYSSEYSLINITGNSVVKFQNNSAKQYGGALYFSSHSFSSFNGYCDVTFHNNHARLCGGAVYSVTKCKFHLEEQSNILFSENCGIFYGGAMCLNDESSVDILANALVMFYYNTAKWRGGALYIFANSNITMKDDSTMNFTHNKVDWYGGAIYCYSNSSISHEGKDLVFAENKAGHGGAIFILQSTLLLLSSTRFINNKAKAGGGAINLQYTFNVSFDKSSKISFYDNTAIQYGGAIYGVLTQYKNFWSKIAFNMNITLDNNSAIVGPHIYFDVSQSCDDKCFHQTVVVNDTGLKSNIIRTSPSKLTLDDPAIAMCGDNITNCKSSNTYVIKNIMLGQEIIIDARVQDYYNNSADGEQFFVTITNATYNISDSPKFISIFDRLEGIKIIGEEVSTKTNITVSISLHSGEESNRKPVIVNLTTELSPCYLGFYYNAPKCSCFNDSGIVTCSGSESYIKKGYWFGIVGDKSTVTTCPNNYCKFNCCESTNGHYQLSPNRTNRYFSHRNRTAAACGRCEEGYTLSFDSIECVSIKKCTTGQTLLVVTLSMIYWIVIVILVFILTYCHVGIGYLYAITYYYSMLDILLGQNMYLSRGLFTADSIISSFAKIIPQFLGQQRR